MPHRCLIEGHSRKAIMILPCYRKMLALFPTRTTLFAGGSPLLKALSGSNTASFRTGVQFQNRVTYENGPLTLASLGFERELDSVKKDTNGDRDLSSALKVSSKKDKSIKSSGRNAEKMKTEPEIETAPFSTKSFSELGLSPLLIEHLNKEGLKIPTDVQFTAIPTIFQNHDVVIQSYTGSGKTLAYLLPILSQVGPLGNSSKEVEHESKQGIQAVIVAPSRELGMQIVREVEKLLGPANKRLVQQLVGGANRSRQEEALKKNKPFIVVGTPGRITEISEAGKLHTHGSRFLVLDEVDQLLSFTFREHMHRILEHVGRRPGAGPSGTRGSVVNRTDRQTIMVSATVPFSVIRAARSWGRDPLLAQAKQVVPLESLFSVEAAAPPVSTSASNKITQGAKDSLPPALEHYYCVTKTQHKVDTSRRCVHALNARCVIVFMNNTQQLKDTVFKLEARGMKAAELHGELGKLARSTTLKKFKEGEVRVLVTNELSARGLDVLECDLVINLDLPTDTIHYAHRAGRTGRLGRKGTVVTICVEPEVFVVKKFRRQLDLAIRPCEFVEGKIVICKEEEAKVLNQQ